MEDIKAVLLDTHKNMKQHSLDYFMANPTKFDSLVELSFSDGQPEAWRATWILADLVKINPVFRNKIQTYASRIVASLPVFNSPGQIREYLKVLQLIELNEDDMGVLLNLCFDWLVDRKADQSFRVHSMQIIFDYSQKEPDLLQEFTAILEQEMEWAKPGFRSRGKKILRRIKA